MQVQPRKRRVLALVLAIGLVGLPSASSTAQSTQPLVEDEDSTPSDGTELLKDVEVEGIQASEGVPTLSGLGRYGRSGTIDRLELPTGLQDRITDEALKLANEPALRSSRRSWTGPEDFVDQIDYQLQFRADFDFLSSEASVIGRAMETGDRSGSAFDQLGLLLTPQEATELGRRDYVGDQMEAVQANLGQKVVDISQDQMDGGKIRVYIERDVDLSAVFLPKTLTAGDVKFIQVDYSKKQLKQFQNRLHNQLRNLPIDWFMIDHSRTDEGIQLRVTVPDVAEVPTSFGRRVPKDAYFLSDDEVATPANKPDADHDWDKLSPGQGILLEAGPFSNGCTWGINGHTENWNYLVSAGHCVNNGLGDFKGWVDKDDFQVFNRPRLKFLTRSDDDNYLYSNFNGVFDSMRVTVHRANSNCYHGSSGDDSQDCAFFIENRATHNSWEVGRDRTCASLGKTNTYRCGNIEDIDQSFSKGNFDSKRMVRTAIRIQGGDSGSGAKWNNTFDGLLTVAVDRNLAFDKSLMVTAFDVKRGLGPSDFDFNCDIGVRVKRPGDWGRCPAIDR